MPNETKDRPENPYYESHAAGSVEDNYSEESCPDSDEICQY